MAYRFKKGSSFIHTFEPKRVPEHLYIVLNNPIVDEDDRKVKVIIVNLSSVIDKKTRKRKKRSQIDTTCMFDGDEHESLTHLSFVFYRGAMLIEVEKLRLIYKLKSRDGFNYAKVKRITDGILDSKYTPKDVKEFYKKYFQYENRKKNFNRINRISSMKIPDGEFKYLW